MAATRRLQIAVGVLVALLAGVALWNVTWMLQQRGSAQQGREDLTACEDIARDIAALRDRPKLAATESLGGEWLDSRIDAALRDAGLAPPKETLRPAERRLADSPYLEKPTVLVMPSVPLPQLAGFLYHLNDDAIKVAVRDLHLRAPRGESVGNVWDADVTVTYLIYSPLAKERDER